MRIRPLEAVQYRNAIDEREKLERDENAKSKRKN